MHLFTESEIESFSIAEIKQLGFFCFRRFTRDTLLPKLMSGEVRVSYIQLKK